MFSDAQLAQMFPRIIAAAASLGLRIGERTHTYNSRNAQELGKWAESEGKGDEFRKAVYRSYFAEGKNIALPEVLATICEGVWLDPKTAHTIIEEGTYSGAVDADWDASRNKGIRAVPTVLLGNKVLQGAQPFDALEGVAKEIGLLKR
jgi:predicted DsbA family dithiol-disulfide isomerase